jgi:lysozyme
MSTIDTTKLLATPPWVKQTTADLARHEGFGEFAYPDPLSQLAKKYPARKYGWGKRPARIIAAELGLTEKDLDQGRPWTFGHGFTHRVTPDSTIKLEASMHRLKDELLDHVKDLHTILPEWRSFPTYAQTVVANMAFNLGIQRFGKFKQTLDLLNRREFAAAGKNLRGTLWYKQVGHRSAELVERLEKGIIQPAFKVI